MVGLVILKESNKMEPLGNNTSQSPHYRQVTNLKNENLVVDSASRYVTLPSQCYNKENHNKVVGEKESCDGTADSNRVVRKSSLPTITEGKKLRTTERSNTTEKIYTTKKCNTLWCCKETPCDVDFCNGCAGREISRCLADGCKNMCRQDAKGLRCSECSS